MRTTFVCCECGATRVPPRDQFAENIEYLRIDQAERLYRKRQRLVCRLCVLRFKHGADQQQAML